MIKDNGDSTISRSLPIGAKRVLGLLTPWQISSEGRTSEGHGQSGRELTITNPDIPLVIKVSIPMAPDGAVDAAANYVLAALNMMEAGQ